jgi:hypothetical protein
LQILANPAPWPESDEAQLNDNPRRRRRSHKSKSVTTTEELVLHRILISGFVIGAVLVAYVIAKMASVR